MKQNENLHIIMCHCEGSLCSDKTISDMKSLFKEGAGILNYPSLCRPGGLKDFTGSLKNEKVVRSVVAGCSKVYDEAFLLAIAEALGMARDSLFPVNIGTPDIQSSQNKSGTIIKQIQKGFQAASFIPVFDKKTIPMDQDVLVIGGGIAGISIAREVHELGYRVFLLEKESDLGGLLHPGKTETDHDMSYQHHLKHEGIEVHTNSTLLSLEGSVGSFRAVVSGPGEEKNITCGAVIVAVGRCKGLSSDLLKNISEKHPGICNISDVANRVAALPRKKETRRIALLMDYNIEETKAGAERSFHLALTLQKDHKNQVFIFSRETRVSAKPLEALLDKVQDAGVVIVKYEDKPCFNTDPVNDLRTEIIYTDTVLQQRLQLSCDIIGISLNGIYSGVEPQLADLIGLNRDALGQLQDNNVYLFPGNTNRPGIFVAGACSGRDYIPNILTDAKATALSVHHLLSNNKIEIELSAVTVDEDKCVLCLTCIRSCPFHAMVIDPRKDIAASIPEVCQKCGSCVGECPAKAITLPAYSEDVILSQIDYK